ncbi:MaoC family dehydratase [Nocardioides alcanivorans]|uniref:MaoC family dehydratase n=1 Tax=Nocardioides alcanivorans TaxID=2897352 RepID=UPI001F2FCBC0|nr:MaoC family dehydratase [Nocardioides alcanivorans]
MTLAPTRVASQVTVGEALPEHPIPLTRTLIVATALASRDYQDVHHDPALAVERGSADIFMNILTSNGLVEKYVAEWAGPAAVVKKIKIRLGTPNYPGDTMTMTGEVTDVDGRLVTVKVNGVNSLGSHASGSVVIELPEETA